MRLAPKLTEPHFRSMTAATRGRMPEVITRPLTRQPPRSHFQMKVRDFSTLSARGLFSSVHLGAPYNWAIN